MRKRFSEEQIIGILAEAEHGSDSIRDVCRRHNLTEQTFFRWRNKYGAMAVSEVRRLKELELENSRLKKIVAEQALAIDGLREIAGKKY
jgi:putative transposase